MSIEMVIAIIEAKLVTSQFSLKEKEYLYSQKCYGISESLIEALKNDIEAYEITLRILKDFSS